MTTIDDLATALDVSVETIETLAGQLQDEDLYSTETGVISSAGAELITDQVRADAEPIGADILQEVTDATVARQQADARWITAIKAAFAHGHTRQAIADRARIHRTRVYQIVTGR